MKRTRILTLTFILAVAVAAVCLCCRKTPHVPTVIQRDVHLIQTKAVATPSEARASQLRTAVVPEGVSAAVAVVCGRDVATAGRYEARMNQGVKQ